MEILSFSTEKMLYLGAQMELADSPQHNLRRDTYYRPIETVSTPPEDRQTPLSKNITFFCTKCDPLPQADLDFSDPSGDGLMYPPNQERVFAEF